MFYTSSSFFLFFSRTSVPPCMPLSCTIACFSRKSLWLVEFEMHLLGENFVLVWGCRGKTGMDTLQKYLGSWISILRVIGCLNDGTDSDNTNYIMVHDPMLTQIHAISSRFLCWYMFSVLLSYCSFCHFYCSLTLTGCLVFPSKL